MALKTDFLDYPTWVFFKIELVVVSAKGVDSMRIRVGVINFFEIPRPAIVIKNNFLIKIV